MSTRSIIVVTGKSKYNGVKTTRLYKHSDGYPTGNLPIIEKALMRALRQNQTKAVRFSEPSPQPIGVDQLVGLIIGEATDEYGMGARIDDSGEFLEAFKVSHLGDQWDLEWMYIVDLENKTVSIYGGDFTNGPKAAYKRGTKDPLSYVKKLRRECQADETLATQTVVNDIEAWGFKVNPKNKQRAARSSITKAKHQLGLV